MLSRFSRAFWPGVLLWSRAYSTCYFRNGSVDLRYGIQRCDSIFQHNMCCWLDAAPAYPDVCTPQGLCLSNTTEEPSQLYLDSCADPKWTLGCSPLADFCSKTRTRAHPLGDSYANGISEKSKMCLPLLPSHSAMTIAIAVEKTTRHAVTVSTGCRLVHTEDSYKPHLHPRSRLDRRL